jgi:hypothetical protein
MQGQESQPQQMHSPPEQQQQFNYPSSYSGNQTYEGWPGMALKQIMGQIDLLNFQNPSYGNSSKWSVNKDVINNHNGNVNSTCNNNGYIQTSCSERMAASNATHHHRQQQQFKTNGYDCGQMDDNSMAWLGPQLWNRKIRIDASNEGSTHGGQNLISGGMSLPEAIIKTETEVESAAWYNFDDRSSSCEASSISQDDEFSQADLALASAPGINFDPRTRCFTPEELKPQPIVRKRRKASRICYLSNFFKKKTVFNKENVKTMDTVFEKNYHFTYST